ncbi:MAG: PTS 2-O-a-mannosyl-D-glycerate transporter subunit IIABC [Culicoidibacterales bacterium]
MELTKITQESLIVTHGKVKTKKEAIELLVKKIDEAGKLESHDEFLQAVFEREGLSPTGFEGNLAIPHGKSTAVKEATFAVLTVEEPIADWESVDPTNEVKLVFLLAIPESEAGTTHLTILSELVKRLSNESYKQRLLTSQTPLELYGALDSSQQAEVVAVAPKQNKTVLAITACPAGIAHTYMAAEALQKAGKEMGIDVYVEKQGANGIEDPHTPELIASAEAIIYATDVAPKNTDRFSQLPVIRTRVATPLREAKSLLQQALDAGEQDNKSQRTEQVHQEEVKEKWHHEVKASLLTGISHITPLIIAGGMILTFAILASQMFNLQDLYGQEGSWLWLVRQIGGGLVGTLLVPVLSAYMAYSLAEKPGLAPGFAAGLAANVIGAGFLGGMLGGLLAGYTARLLRKYIPAKGTFAGFVSFWVYPVVGSTIVMLIMLFIVGQPVMWLNDSLIGWLDSLGGTSAILLGAIIGAMVSFDLGGPVNKAAYAFAIASIASGNFLPYAVFASVKMVSAFAVTMATMWKRHLFTADEREIGKQTWMLGLAGITEGAIPFMIEDPIRVIPSLVVGSAVTGAIVAYFGLGLSVPGAGIFSIVLLESNLSSLFAGSIWFFAAVIGAVIAAALLVLTRQNKIANAELAKENATKETTSAAQLQTTEAVTQAV